MDPIKRLYDNRNNLREKNLILNIKIWEYILKNIEEENISKKVKNSETLAFKLLIDTSEFKKKDVEAVLTSVASQIFKINSIEFNIEHIEQINMAMVKKKINAILKSPKEIQAHFCKNPNKQTCDEILQREMINEKINLIGLSAYKANPSRYIFDGKLTSNNVGAKSIDVFVSNNDIKPEKYFDSPSDFIDKLVFFGYQKTIMVTGGHQNNQLNDIKKFINLADEYINKNTDNAYFFIQADGDYCVDNMPALENEINNKNKIFAGTTTDVIKWIKNVKKQF